MSSDPHLESLSIIIPEATDDDLSTCIKVVDQWSFPPRSCSSSVLPMIMDNENGDDELDSILIQKEQIPHIHHDIIPTNDSTGLLSPLIYASDRCACNSVLQGSNYARTDDHELDSTTFMLEAADHHQPNLREGLLECMPMIDSSTLSAPPVEYSDELNLLLQDISCSSTRPIPHEKTRDDHIDEKVADLSRLIAEKESSAILAEPMISGKGSSLSSTAKRLRAKSTSTRKIRNNNYRLKRLQAGDKAVEAAGISTVKKQEHNAKERLRRMKLHASYLALGALLPADSSCRSKKRKSAPLIIDRAVEHIPKLEEEIEKLTLMKNDMLSKIKNKQPPLNHNPNYLQFQHPSVSVHEIRKGEVIIQICMSRSHPTGHLAFSNLLHKVEGEEKGMCIMSASTLQVSNDGVCCHLHVQMHASLDGANHLASLREKVSSWLQPLIP